MNEFKVLEYWKANAEEDYLQVPISILRYISELEKHIEKSCAPEMLEFIKSISENYVTLHEKAQQLIKKATD